MTSGHEPHALASFTRHLEQLVAQLSDTERTVLWALLLAGMDPVDRMRFRSPQADLSDEQVALLDRLDADG